MTNFIAEVSSNHNRDLDRCMEFIKVAATIGCSAVKFQLFKVAELFTPEILNVSLRHKNRERWELPVEFIPKLKNYCTLLGLEFGCTPFYLNAVIELEPYVDFYKIASYELLLDDLLIACAETEKPVIISTGMAGLDEIDHALAVLAKAGCHMPTLLHCVSSYPSPKSECNLSIIEYFRERYGVKVGWSDHSADSEVVRRAFHHWKADCVEFHLDLDCKGEEYESGHCWLPQQIEPIIKEANASKIIDGKPNLFITASEEGDRQWRADPVDGLRPLRRYRHDLIKKLSL